MRLIIEIQIELNRVRVDPTGYAIDVLFPRLNQFDGKYYKPTNFMTKEGVVAVRECIDVMIKTPPRPPLSLEKGLCLSAKWLADDQASHNTTGHDGSDGSKPWHRMNRYGKWSGSCAENCAYGFSDAREIVAQLLIDDGVASRGHRTNILNAKLKKVGIGYKYSTSYTYRAVTVMDFAAAYTSD